MLPQLFKTSLLATILLMIFACTEQKLSLSENNKLNAQDSIKDTVVTKVPKFPEDWVGTYKGDLQWFHAKGSLLIPMTIEIRRIDSLADTYLWRSTYDSTERFPMVVKDYLLVHPDSLEAGHYLIDEKDGIYLDMILIDNTFYSNFEVNKSLLVSIDRLEADGSLYHEIISSNFVDARESGTQSGKTYFGVKSYSKIGTQKGLLKRIKDK